MALSEPVTASFKSSQLIGDGEDPSSNNSMVDMFTRIFRKKKTGVK
jgi:hypothetical protein